MSWVTELPSWVRFNNTTLRAFAKFSLLLSRVCISKTKRNSNNLAKFSSHLESKQFFLSTFLNTFFNRNSIFFTIIKTRPDWSVQPVEQGIGQNQSRIGKNQEQLPFSVLQLISSVLKTMIFYLSPFKYYYYYYYYYYYSQNLIHFFIQQTSKSLSHFHQSTTLTSQISSAQIFTNQTNSKLSFAKILSTITSKSFIRKKRPKS